MNKIIKLQKKVTFETITEDFLIYKKQQIKESTYFNYTYKIQKYLLPVFKDLTLEEIAKYDFNKFTNGIAEEQSSVAKKKKTDLTKTEFATNSQGDVDPIKLDNTDSKFLFDNEDAIIFDLKKGN